MIEEKQFLDVASKILVGDFHLEGLSVDDLLMANMGEGCKKVFAGNLCLNLFDSSVKGLMEKCYAMANASEYNISVNMPNEHFMDKGYNFIDINDKSNQDAVAWYVTARN